ncbi:hypothetical protein AOR13_816 [Alteromonas stellipolaris LMG 21856]|jgi:hypothetical protein|nr:hypothetical protein AOR13_816 [Alteromonas stellipolaris LMG 21856]|tara:strand:- start:7089 stop:7205 length:117 start_codon:yes stop_codon:yes gene_type:complete
MHCRAIGEIKKIVGNDKFGVTNKKGDGISHRLFLASFA